MTIEFSSVSDGEVKVIELLISGILEQDVPGLLTFSTPDKKDLLSKALARLARRKLFTSDDENPILKLKLCNVLIK